MVETTNTLFRFATARNPELVSQEVKQKYFVHHPDPSSEGHFKSLVATPITNVADRLQAWKNLAATFTAFSGIDTVKAFTGNIFYEFALALAKNSSVPTNGITPLTQVQLITIWDNLFYQLVTNASAPLKDLISQILVANHYLQASVQYGVDEEMALARIVIPQAFFATDSSETEEANTLPRIYTKELEKYIDVEVAQRKAKDLEKAIADLKIAQDNFINKTLNDTNYV